MKAMYDVEVTITLDGDDVTCLARGYVSVEDGAATLDGTPEVLLVNRWRDVRDFSVSARDLTHIEECLCDVALDEVAA